MLNYLAERYKTISKANYFRRTLSLQKKYAFIGTGKHATTHLYPILQHFGVPLKYIFSGKKENSQNMCAVFKNCLPASTLSQILEDKEIAGVFVCTTPSAHFDIARQLLENGKHVFIEKPPCQTLQELETLKSKQGNSIFHVNFQQRYSPAIVSIKKIAAKAKFYRIEYQTGFYSSENVLTELFIHPLDIALHLFGKLNVCAGQKIITASGITYLVQLNHASGMVGELRLSTAYSWQNAIESIEVHTGKDVYNCEFPFKLTRTVLPSPVLGVPVEKILKSPLREEVILNGHTIDTSLPNHTSYLYGFYNSVDTFIQNAEDNKQYGLIEDLKPLYRLIEQLAAL